ncbi:MAG: T9SS type A sorting domain-containing protein [Bacteroidia bacterium]
MSFIVYPGLVKDETELKAELVGEITEQYNFVIVDQLGKTIFQETLNSEKSRLVIPVEHLADGIYYYRLTQGLEEVKHGRFMKVEK